MPQLDLVFGASGYIGTNLTGFLAAEGRSLRACARSIEVLQARQWQGVQLCEADALDPASLTPALEGVDVAFYLVHSMAAGRSFAALDAQAARNFAAAAEDQGVRRIVYLGGLVPHAPRSRHLRSRQETGDILRAGKVPVTEIRAGMIIGPGSAAWEVIRDLVNHLPVMITPRWVYSRSTPIALDNLLRYLADVAAHDETANEVYDVAGPDVLTYEAIMRRYGVLVDKNPIIVPVPVLTPRLSSYWLRLVTSVPTNIARALIDGLSQDVIAADDRLAQLIPQELLGFDAAAKRALDADRRHAIPVHWAENAIACRTFHPQHAYYSKRAEGRARSTASAAMLYAEVCRIGHRGDYFSARLLWWLRRATDWVVGGPSFRRRRRHPEALRVGDAVDAWRVIAVEPAARLTLLMEMRGPGFGVLEFTITDDKEDREIHMCAYWHPAGVWGLMYWYALLIPHLFIFRNTTREISRRAESR